MSKLEQLSTANTIYDLAKVLGYKAKALSYIVYSKETKYYEFEIPKKTGGKRVIQAPNDKLKKLQSRLGKLLSDCLDEINKSQESPKVLSHGFRRKYSIISNASNHKKKRFVFNADLKDFFPTINFGRVRGFFIKNHHFNLDPKIATIIAQIACVNNGLPQGSPCSPIISNLIGHLLDVRLVNLAKQTKCTYSRYADDITFSTNNRNFPIEIAEKEKGNKWVVGKKLNKEIEKAGFNINPKKVSMQYQTSRQIATGLIVNKKVNIKREYYKQARSYCHSLFHNDKYFLDEDIEGNLKQLEGILSFIYQIKRPYDNRKLDSRLNNPDGITKLYRSFLFYKHFFLNDKPILICEGKTDITHLKCAMNNLSSSFPYFTSKKDGRLTYNVNFLKFTKRLKDVYSISEGTPGIKSIMKMYKKIIDSFTGEGLKAPVIIILDTDKGTNEIKRMLKENSYDLPFQKYVSNLYVTFISNEVDIEIEDLYDRSILDSKIDGKKFNKNKKHGDNSEYGKYIFAEKVIKPRQDKIDFKNFDYMLSAISSVIKDYDRR